MKCKQDPLLLPFFYPLMASSGSETDAPPAPTHLAQALQGHFHMTKGHFHLHLHWLYVPGSYFHTQPLPVPTHSRFLDSSTHLLEAVPAHLPSRLLLTHPLKPIARECISSPLSSWVISSSVNATILTCTRLSLFSLCTVHVHALAS